MTKGTEGLKRIFIIVIIIIYRAETSRRWWLYIGQCMWSLYKRKY
jgi:hypothetical protein